MSTFQTVVYAVIHGISEFLPISSRAHHELMAYLLGWAPPSGALLAAFMIGSLIALFVYFRHDWASMISSVLQVLIYRKRPMTLDERIPLFIALSVLPMVVASFYMRNAIQEVDWNPLTVAAVLGGASLPLWFVDYWSRKIKGLYDWNWIDASIVGVAQATALFPGWDGFCGILFGALFLNYKREPALKYAYFAYFPILMGRTIAAVKEVDFHSAVPMPDLSWMSFVVAILVTCFVGLLVIGGSMKQIHQKGLGQYMFYRCLLAIVVCAFYWMRTHAG